jgi:hypothetical protein
MRRVWISAAAAIAASTAVGGALGDDVDPSGIVSAVAGETVVVRGAQTQPLALGDKLFVGDRVITRSSGEVTFRILGCEKVLGPAASILIDEDICTKTAIVLGAPVGAAAVNVASAPAAAPGLLLPLMVGGGAAGAGAIAALTGGGDPPSP